MSSSGLHELVDACKAGGLNGLEVVLRDPPDAVRRVLEIVCVDEAVTVVPPVAPAARRVWRPPGRSQRATTQPLVAPPL
jgi:anti-anti-sigma regulatory factor